MKTLRMVRTGMEIDKEQDAELLATGMDCHRITNNVVANGKLYFIDIAVRRPWKKPIRQMPELSDELNEIHKNPCIVVEFSDCGNMHEEMYRHYQFGEIAVANGTVKDPKLAHFAHYFATLDDAIQAFSNYVGEDFSGIQYVDEIEYNKICSEMTNLIRERRGEYKRLFSTHFERDNRFIPEGEARSSWYVDWLYSTGVIHMNPLFVNQPDVAEGFVKAQALPEQERNHYFEEWTRTQDIYDVFKWDERYFKKFIVEKEEVAL